MAARNKEYLAYAPYVHPAYFTETDNGFEHKSGTQSNKISISLIIYTSVDFLINS